MLVKLSSFKCLATIHKIYAFSHRKQQNTNLINLQVNRWKKQLLVRTQVINNLLQDRLFNNYFMKVSRQLAEENSPADKETHKICNKLATIQNRLNKAKI